MREGSPRQQREIGAGASVPPSQPPFWRPSPPRTGGRAGHLGAPSSLRSGAPGADPGGASPCAQPPCTVVPSSNVQGQLGLKPPARDRAPSFSQREAVSSRKNRVSVTGPLAPSASAWQSWGRETQRGCTEPGPVEVGGGPRLGSAPARVWLGAGAVRPAGASSAAAGKRAVQAARRGAWLLRRVQPAATCPSPQARRRRQPRAPRVRVPSHMRAAGVVVLPARVHL